MNLWQAIVVGCTAFLGTVLANWLTQPQAKPRHPKQATPQHFPIDLDTADQPRGDHPQHVRPGEGDL